MKKTGSAPYLRTVALCLAAYSWKTFESCGCTGHWLQSMMIAASKGLSKLLKTTLLLASNEYEPTPPGLKCASTSCQLMPEPLIVAEVAR